MKGAHLINFDRKDQIAANSNFCNRSERCSRENCKSRDQSVKGKNMGASPALLRAGEREKRCRRLQPASAASTDTVWTNAPHREDYQQEANRIRRRQLISVHRIIPHAPLERSVRVDTVDCVHRTRLTDFGKYINNNG